MGQPIITFSNIHHCVVCIDPLGYSVDSSTEMQGVQAPFHIKLITDISVIAVIQYYKGGKFTV